jgi:hypothetical protein
LKISPVKRINDIERENFRLKKAIADLTLDNAIAKEEFQENDYSPTYAASFKKKLYFLLKPLSSLSVFNKKSRLTNFKNYFQL